MPWSFASAAILLEESQTAADIESLLLPAKVGKPLYRKQSHTKLRFWYSVPAQLDSWNLMPGGTYGDLNVVFESDHADQARQLAERTIDLFTDPPTELHSIELTLHSDGRLFVSRSYAPDVVQMDIASSAGFSGLPLDLVTPWLSAPGATLTLKDGKTVKTEWTLADVEAEFQSQSKSRLRLIAPVSEFEAPFLAALKTRLEAGIDYAYSYLLIGANEFQTTTASLMKRLPGFVNTGMFVFYHKGFNPYTRPIEVDSGQSVRYPLFSAQLRSGSFLQVDCLHRPQRPSLLDIQVAHLTDKSKPGKDLQKVLEKIDAPHDLWQGPYVGRWE